MDCTNKPPRWVGEPANREAFRGAPESFPKPLKRPHGIGIGRAGVIATIRTSGKAYLAYQFSNRKGAATAD
jgi:hypothetical protein